MLNRKKTENYLISYIKYGIGATLLKNISNKYVSNSPAGLSILDKNSCAGEESIFTMVNELTIYVFNDLNDSIGLLDNNLESIEFFKNVGDISNIVITGIQNKNEKLIKSINDTISNLQILMDYIDALVALGHSERDELNSWLEKTYQLIINMKFTRTIETTLDYIKKYGPNGEAVVVAV